MTHKTHKFVHRRGTPLAWILIALIALQVAILSILLANQTGAPVDQTNVDQTCWPGNDRPEKAPRPLHKLPCDRLPISIHQKA